MFVEDADLVRRGVGTIVGAQGTGARRLEAWKDYGNVVAGRLGEGLVSHRSGSGARRLEQCLLQPDHLVHMQGARDVGIDDQRQCEHGVTLGKELLLQSCVPAVSRSCGLLGIVGVALSVGNALVWQR